MCVCVCVCVLVYDALLSICVCLCRCVCMCVCMCVCVCVVCASIRRMLDMAEDDATFECVTHASYTPHTRLLADARFERVRYRVRSPL